MPGSRGRNAFYERARCSKGSASRSERTSRLGIARVSAQGGGVAASPGYSRQGGGPSIDFNGIRNLPADVPGGGGPQPQREWRKLKGIKYPCGTQPKWARPDRCGRVRQGPCVLKPLKRGNTMETKMKARKATHCKVAAAPAQVAVPRGPGVGRIPKWNMVDPSPLVPAPERLGL